MAYTGNPSTLARDMVRLLVGDISTSTASELLANADYTALIAATPNSYAAASLAANSLAALFSGQAAGVQTKTVGDLTITRSDAANVAAGYRGLAQKLTRMAAAQITPYAGGISQDDKANVEAETTRARPAFLRGLFDNPQTLDPTKATTST